MSYCYSFPQARVASQYFSFSSLHSKHNHESYQDCKDQNKRKRNSQGVHLQVVPLHEFELQVVTNFSSSLHNIQAQHVMKTKSFWKLDLSFLLHGFTCPPTIYMGCVSVCESNLYIQHFVKFVIRVGDYFRWLGKRQKKQLSYMYSNILKCNWLW